MQEDILKHLVNHGINPSIQRIAVMKYLMEHRTHPTVDEIYSALHPTIPTLSKTTVYNTLKLLTDHGAALQLTIDERKTCYDADTSAHAHFLCAKCGKVYDVRLIKKDIDSCAEMPEGFCCQQTDLYFRGMCKSCSEQQNNHPNQDSKQQ